MHSLFVQKYRWKHTEAYDIENLYVCTFPVFSYTSFLEIIKLSDAKSRFRASNQGLLSL